jgi:RNA polymerase sigma factor (sigma-70 family)
MSPPFPTDAALVMAARNRNPLAWNALLARYDAQLTAVCRAHRLSTADTADVKQTTWLRAVEHMQRLRDPERVTAWLTTVARHECRRHLRHAMRVRPGDDDAGHRQPDPDAAPDSRLLARERRAAVRTAVVALPQRDRALLSMLYDEPAPSYSEIGRTLGMPIGSIGPTRARVLQRLRRQPDVARLAAAA